MLALLYLSQPSSTYIGMSANHTLDWSLDHSQRDGTFEVQFHRFLDHFDIIIATGIDRVGIPKQFVDESFTSRDFKCRCIQILGDRRFSLQTVYTNRKQKALWKCIKLLLSSPFLYAHRYLHKHTDFE